MKTPELITIEKVLNNEGTSEQAHEVTTWLGTPEGEAWLSARMDADLQSIKEGEEDLYIDHPVPSVEMYNYIMKKIRRQKMRRLVFRAAAILIPMLLIATLLIKLDSQVDLFATAEYDEVFVPKGEQLQIMFQDGSKVFLNSESRIRYPRKFGLSKRIVELEGEGWFTISKNKNRPFIVDLKDINVRVLGTNFDVKAYPSETHIAVALEEGSVQLDGHSFIPFTIQPGEKVIYDRSTGKYEIMHPESITTSSAWKSNVLIFSNAPLSEVISTLSRRFDVTFIIEDEAAMEYTYVLRTNHTDLSLILRELEKITPVRFEKQDKIIKVNIKK